MTSALAACPARIVLAGRLALADVELSASERESSHVLPSVRSDTPPDYGPPA